MVRYTLKQLYYFQAVANHGGIAQAARVLNLSQPAIAQALNKLEHQYDFNLFLRHHSRGMELTPQGRELYRLATSLLKQAAQTEQQMYLTAAGKAATIRLGCFHTLAPFYMVPLLRHFNEHLPHIACLAEELRQDKIIQKLRDKELDIAITYDMSLPYSELNKQVITTLQPHVLLSKQHPLAQQENIQAKQLASQPMVMFKGAGSQDYYARLLAELELAPDIALTSSSMETVRSAVGNQLGFAFTIMQPKSQHSYDGSELVSIPLTDDCQGLAIVMLYRETFAEQTLMADIGEVLSKQIK